MLPLVASTALRSIGSFFGRTAISGGGSLLSGVAKKAAGLGFDAVKGTAGLAKKGITAPFKSGGKGTASKLVPAVEQKVADGLQEKMKDRKAQENQKKKQSSKERKDSLDPKKSVVKIEGKPATSVSKRKQVEPGLAVLQKISKTLEVIETNVSSIIESIKAEEKQDKKLAGKKREKAIEAARDDLKPDDKKDDSEPGFVKRNLNKVLQKGAGGILRSIFGLVIKFFAGKFIIENFFPEFKKPIFGFFSQIGDFFINLRDSLKAFIAGDTDLAIKEAKEAGTNFKNVFAQLAKFLSDLIDKALVFMGFEEFNMYDKAVSFIQEIKPKFDKFLKDTKEYFNSLAGDEEKLTQRILNIVSGLVAAVLDKLGDIFSVSNLMTILSYSMDRGDQVKAARKQNRKLDEGKGSFFRRRREAIFEEMREQGLVSQDMNLKDFTKFFNEREKAGTLTDADIRTRDMLEDRLKNDMDAAKEYNLKIAEIYDKRRQLEFLVEMSKNQNIEGMSGSEKRLREQLIEMESRFPDIFGPGTDKKRTTPTRENLTLSSLDKNPMVDGGQLNAGSYLVNNFRGGNQVTNIGQIGNQDNITTSTTVASGGGDTGHHIAAGPSLDSPVRLIAS